MLIKIISQNKGRIFLFLFMLNVLFFGFQYIQYSKTKKLDGKSKEKNREKKFFSLNILSPTDKFPDLNSGKNVVLRLMKNDCKECLDSIFSNTLRLSKSLGKNSVYILISNGYSELQYIGFSRIYQYDLNIYYVPEEITSLDKRGHSYYFIFNREYPMSAKNIYEIRTTADAGHTANYDEWLKGI